VGAPGGPCAPSIQALLYVLDTDNRTVLGDDSNQSSGPSKAAAVDGKSDMI
jgi:hypothetical protein